MSSQTVLVTGGAGFIGSHVVDELVRRRYKVVVVDDLSTGRRDNLNPNVALFKLSTTSSKLRALVAKIKPMYVVHLAAHISVRESITRPLHNATVNILGTINVLEAARAVGVKKIVMASSGGIMYASDLRRAKETDSVTPESPYGISKRAGELYLDHYFRVFKMSFTALRFSNVYGPRQRASSPGEGGVIPNFASMMLKNKQPFIVGRGEQTRDLVYVGDVARAVVLAMRSDYVGVVNISSCEEVTIRRLYDILSHIIGHKAKPEYRQAITGEKTRSCIDNRLAARTLGWKPEVALADGLRKTVAWMKAKKI